jgi:hypothetical protein
MLLGRKLFYTVRDTNIKSKYQRKMFNEKKNKIATP